MYVAVPTSFIISMWLLRFGFLFLVGVSTVSVLFLFSYKSSLLQDDHADGSAVEQYLESSKERQRSSSEAMHDTAKRDSGSKGATYHEDNETTSLAASLATISTPPLEKILRQAMIFKGRHYDDKKAKFRIAS
jgi:hypothetical protein